MADPVLLYDADCGFCRFCVARLLDWDVRARLRPIAIQSAEGQELLAGMPAADRLRSAHAVDADGRIHSGVAAVSVIAAELPAGAPVAWLVGRLPAPTEWAYRWVADHRTGLSRLVPRGLKRGADSRIDRRVAAAPHGPP
jgi:predicted DCC family thiol-disulfide oxidoreductase YuxK